MIAFAILIVILTLLELKELKNNKKDIFIYSVLVLIAIAIGFYYLSDPYEADLVLHLIRLLGRSY